MNRTMLPRGRGNRTIDSCRPSRPSRALPGAVGLVDGIETDSTRSGPNEKRRRVISRRPVTKRGQSTNRVGAFSVLAFEGLHLQSRLLNQGSADKAADAVSLPVGRFHDRCQRRAVLPAQHRDHRGFLTPAARRGGFRLGAGLLPRPGPGSRLCGRVFANVGPQALDTLLRVMTDREAPAASRVRAADVILQAALRGMETEDIEARLATLEQTAPQGNQRR